MSVVDVRSSGSEPGGGAGGGGEHVYVVAGRIEMNGGVGARDIPVVGPFLPGDLLVLHGVDVVYASGDVSDTGAVKGLLGTGWDTAIGKSLQQGTEMSFDLSVLGDNHRSSVHVGGAGGGGGVVPAVVGGPQVGAGGPGPVVWWDAGRKAGPVELSRLGLSYGGKSLWVLLDVAVAAGGLRLAARGLGVGIPLEGGSVSPPVLEGVDVGFRAGPVQIEGAFIKLPTAQVPAAYEWAVGGAATLGVKAFQVQAVGFYAHPTRGRTPSFFVYGGLGSEKGVGNSVLRIRDAKLGFGYNSSVRQPSVKDVNSFPFLQLLQGTGPQKPPLEVLNNLVTGHEKPWVTPAEGSFWLAGGLAGTLLEYADWRAALVLEVGPDFRSFKASLAGNIDAKFPKAGKQYARLALDIAAGYSSADGLLFMDANITPQSFLISHDCKVTGGAALRVWMPPSTHAGDFLFTAGGYHPKYQPLPHYPKPERVGFHWSYNNHIKVTGEAYLALTPNELMAGGRLSLEADYGIRGGADVSVDAYIGWHPVYFDVALHVGGWLDCGWLGTARGGADVEVWGPPTGGRVTIRTFIKDWDFDFGERRAVKKGPVLWQEFKSNMLPNQANNPQDVITAQVVDGLLPEARDTNNAGTPGGPWVVSSDGFSFQVRSTIPFTSATAAGKNCHQEKNITITVLGGSLEVPPLYVRPCSTYIASTVTVSVERDGHSVTDGWKAEVVKEKVPGALWGSEEEDLPEKAVGLRITAPGGVKSGAEIQLSEGLVLAAACEGKIPNPTVKDPQPKVWTFGTTRVTDQIGQQIADQSRKQARQTLYDALPPSVKPADSYSDLTQFAARTKDYLSGEPMLVTSSK
ncbi:DUF6603 domain-containing protein [Streptomyces wuyuanensis]|uniref:DUF6603 domain-containing protein n=1 Tax=Streptomyces wuyuanensis TaxID=1196353 RepID=UPI00341A6B93